MIYEYPTFESLGIAPDFLRLGESAIAGWNATVPPLATARSESSASQHRNRSGRVYASRYAGVRLIRGKWVGCWGPQGHLQGRPRPPTPDGELQAAWDRAAALGRDYLEMRP